MSSWDMGNIALTGDLQVKTQKVKPITRLEDVEGQRGQTRGWREPSVRRTKASTNIGPLIRVSDLEDIGSSQCLLILSLQLAKKLIELGDYLTINAEGLVRSISYLFQNVMIFIECAPSGSLHGGQSCSGYEASCPDIEQ